MIDDNPTLSGAELHSTCKASTSVMERIWQAGTLAKCKPASLRSESSACVWQAPAPALSSAHSAPRRSLAGLQRIFRYRDRAGSVMF